MYSNLIKTLLGWPEHCGTATMSLTYLKGTPMFFGGQVICWRLGVPGLQNKNLANKRMSGSLWRKMVLCRRVPKDGIHKLLILAVETVSCFRETHPEWGAATPPPPPCLVGFPEEAGSIPQSQQFVDLILRHHSAQHHFTGCNKF